MSKNVLITACSKVDDTRLWGKAELHHDLYIQLTEICTKSFETYLTDLDDIVVIAHSYPTYHDLFRDIYYKIKDLYLTKNCNILWVDSDNFCIRPTVIYGKFNKFTTFNYDNVFIGSYRHTKVPKSLYAHLTPWMMSNIRYYPANCIPDSLWNKTDELVKNWINVWAYECIVYNHMFHLQNLTVDEYNAIIKPELNFQYVDTNINKQILDNINIIHIHSTRSVELTLHKLQAIRSLLGEKI